MSILLSLIFKVTSISIQSIPSTGAPPVAKVASAAVYDSLTQNIITLGGQQLSNNLLTSDINIFSLKTLTWDSPEIISEFSPEYLVNHGVYLRQDRKVLAIGRFSEVFLLDIEEFSWTQSVLTGDSVKGVRSYSSTDVIINGTEYMVIFGGINPKGFVNDLYL